MNRTKWLDRAEIIDALRIMPRILVLGFTVFYVWYVYTVTIWYFSLVEPGAWDTTFISSTVTAIGGMLVWFGNKYFASGRDWNKRDRAEEPEVKKFCECCGREK